MTREVAELIRALTERELTVEEAEAYRNAPMSDDERQELYDLIDWFCRRYPLPIDRFRYVTRAYRQWMANSPR